MITLSLDLATTNTGYAVYHDKKLLHSGVHKAKGKDYLTRSKNLLPLITQLCEEFEVTHVVIEDLKVYTEPDTLRKLAILHGMVLATIPQECVFAYISPTVWRKGISSSLNTSRSLSKKRAIAIAQSFFNKAPLTDDEAEALLLGKFFVENSKRC